MPPLRVVEYCASLIHWSTFLPFRRVALLGQPFLELSVPPQPTLWALERVSICAGSHRSGIVLMPPLGGFNNLASERHPVSVTPTSKRHRVEEVVDQSGSDLMRRSVPRCAPTVQATLPRRKDTSLGIPLASTVAMPPVLTPTTSGRNLEEMFLEGLSAHRGQQLVSMVAFLHPRYGRHGSDKLPLASRHPSEWRTCCPARSRRPEA